ncbi:HET-domain-containing protein [Amniculicola lignicola CBS 123094]|uniref:HET-domain-containing protein n=1 Tax=Amniculicola lignicola CBS 123094 TaxID=1392246 RepID=A0A6A5WSR4_9PLEO|nr:HET-domain-containing protein [Amniculicola lignicola CBS 123094]
MRLLHSKTFDFRDFEWGSLVTPPYAILSHTWEGTEVTFQDMEAFRIKNESRRIRKMRGFSKIAACCAQAVRDGYEYVWIDTCCINKESSAELSEAINSMYRWYQGAAICYAYLFDVTAASDEDDFNSIRRSKWFTRGWTLQELIAPSEVHFYGSRWFSLGRRAFLGSRSTLTPILFQTTRIHIEVFAGADIKTYSIAQRMSWASKRQTKRVEDIAYSLMGIFGVSMPMLYGEGEYAFIRLQQEIMKTSDDQSLFA